MADARALSLPSLGILAAAMLLPVTLPVAGLRGLVQDRFDVSELQTSLFMVVNMVAAVIAAPLAGAFADRHGRQRSAIVAALALDGLLFLALSLDQPFESFLALRFLEGAVHISALSWLFSLAAGRGEHDPARGRRMGLLGGGLTLGVALGAPIGGVLAREDSLLPLRVGAGVLFAAALLAHFTLPAGAAARRDHDWRAVLRAPGGAATWLVPLSFAFVDRFTVGFFTTTFPLHLKRTFDAPPDRIGLQLALFLLPFALLSYPFGRLAESRSVIALVCGGSLIYGALCASLGAWSLERLPILMLSLGISSAVMFAPSIALAAQLAPAGHRGAMLGAFHGAGSLGFILGPLIGATVSQWVGESHGSRAGYSAAFAVAGASQVICVAACLPSLLRLRREGRLRKT